jgi:erythromycin esterase
MTDESTDDRQDELTNLAGRLTERTATLATTDPAVDLTDLAPVSDALANARVVGLGEATHGTREFFQLKHRLVRYLVMEHGYRLFGLEANFSETLALDRYVVHGEGSPRDALRGIYFWTWIPRKCSR